MGLRRLARELKEAEEKATDATAVVERKIAAIVSYLHRTGPGMPDPRFDDDPDPDAPPGSGLPGAAPRPGRAT